MYWYEPDLGLVLSELKPPSKNIKFESLSIPGSFNTDSQTGSYFSGIRCVVEDSALLVIVTFTGKSTLGMPVTALRPLFVAYCVFCDWFFRSPEHPLDLCSEFNSICLKMTLGCRCLKEVLSLLDSFC